MRALYALAAMLGTTVAALCATLSAQEFSRWQLWMHASQIGPEWADQHRAQALAAAHNAGQFARKGGGAFSSQDFRSPDPWVDAAESTPEQVLARQQAEYEALLRAADV